MITHFTDS